MWEGLWIITKSAQEEEASPPPQSLFFKIPIYKSFEITFTQKRKSHIPIGKGQNEELYSCWNGKFDPVILHKV